MEGIQITTVPDSKYLVSYGDMDPAMAAPYACSGLTAFSALKKIPETSSDDWIIVIGAGGVGINGVFCHQLFIKLRF